MSMGGVNTSSREGPFVLLYIVSCVFRIHYGHLVSGLFVYDVMITCPSSESLSLSQSASFVSAPSSPPPCQTTPLPPISTRSHPPPPQTLRPVPLLPPTPPKTPRSTARPFRFPPHRRPSPDARLPPISQQPPPPKSHYVFMKSFAITAPGFQSRTLA